MKPLKAKIYFLQILFAVVATVFAVIAVLFASQMITFTPAVWGYINPGENQTPIILGVISGFHLMSFLAFIFIYLSFEFYGFKNAFYTLICNCIVMCGIFIALHFLNRLNQSHPALYFDEHMLEAFKISRGNFVAGLLAYASGVTITLLLAVIIKKITRDYFMFFRYLIATSLGFAGTVIFETALLNGGSFEWNESSLPLVATPLAQRLLLILIFVVPLYVLRIALFLFRGRPAKTSELTKPVEIKVEEQKIENTEIKSDENDFLYKPNQAADDAFLESPSATEPPAQREKI